MILAIIMLKSWIYFNPHVQLKDTEWADEKKVKKSLNELSGFKFVIFLVSKFKKQISKDKTRNSIFYLNSKAELIYWDSDIDSVWINLSCSFDKISKYKANRLGWTIDSVIQQNIDISKCKPLSGDSYIRSLKKRFD